MRLLQFENLTEIESPNELSILFEKLGYNVDCRELDTEALELTAKNQESIYRSYYLADYQNSQIQVLFLELKYNSETEIKQKLKGIAHNLSNRQTNFFILGTMDYEQLFVVTTLKKLNQNYNLEIISKIGIVNLRHPNIFDVNILEKLAIKDLNSDYFYREYHNLLTFTSSKRKEKQTSLNTVDSYLKTIGKIPLLSKEQEIILARKVKKFEEIKKLSKNLTQEELAVKLNLTVKQLQDEFYLGKLAKDKLITTNLRLVVSIAKRYINRGLSFLDLIQEGNLGLIRATEKFDPTKGYKLSTYATWWIRQSITRAIADQSRLIRLPVHLWETLNQMNKMSSQLQLEGNYNLINLATKLNKTPSEIRKLKTYLQEVLSLDMTVGIEKDTTLEDLLISSYSGEYLEHLENKEIVSQLLSLLNEKEKAIIIMRFGLETGRPMTLQEIGDKLNLTRERIRQIEDKCLKKFRLQFINKEMKTVKIDNQNKQINLDDISSQKLIKLIYTLSNFVSLLISNKQNHGLRQGKSCQLD